jgi:LmbE family N-acetylglucosaminyl deacetylase
MRNYCFRFFAIVLAFVFVFAPLAPGRAEAQVRRVYDNGALGLGQLLRRLQTTASAMHTGAHPDDEDTPLITRLARGDGARVVYLSLNRGEGGQNIIGNELFEPLGVIRTEELLQSRALDGGQQMFTRVMDYGFSKTRAEAAEKWGEQLTLGDMVRAIRTFRPLVIFSRFSGTPADGHGQHQLAGYLTPIAFKAAADPKQFPEQIREGLRPWQARKLYVGQGFRDTSAPPLRMDTGLYDPLLGRSYAEIAAEGRSQHKSQEMGSLELRGAFSSGLKLLDRAPGMAGDDKGFFDGVDTSIKGIGKLTGLPEGLLENDFIAIQEAAERALKGFDALYPARSVSALGYGLAGVRRARSSLTTSSAQGSQAAQDADFLLANKEAEFSQALQLAAGVVVDALANTETIVAGESLSVTARVFAPEGADVKIGAATLILPNGWRVEAAPEPTPQAGANPFRPTRETGAANSFFNVSVPANAAPTTPYWLERPRQGYVFDWPDAAPKNQPFGDALISAETKLTVGGSEITVKRGVQYRYRDDIRGEVRRELNVVPALSVALDTNLIIAPVSKKPQTQRLAVRVTNFAPRNLKANVALRLPDGWKSEPALADVSFTKKGERAAAVFTVTIPANAKPDAYKITAQASENQVYNREMKTVAYPHIRTHRYYVPAEATARVLDVKTAPVKVGYLMGSGDTVPEAIKRLGLDVAMLDEDALASGDLAQFQTIVVGVRASEVRQDFIANNTRLLDFVKNGGTLIVQFQHADIIPLLPYPAQMAARVTDENAKVTILQPQHPAFNFPNKITDEDFSGWVQERNLYSFTTFDEKYAPLLESHDAGEPENKGGLVYAELGKGRYVYTSYAFFRQLPAGVSGAYRLWANLLSLGATKQPKK